MKQKIIGSIAGAAALAAMILPFSSSAQTGITGVAAMGATVGSGNVETSSQSSASTSMIGSNSSDMMSSSSDMNTSMNTSQADTNAGSDISVGGIISVGRGSVSVGAPISITSSGQVSSDNDVNTYAQSVVASDSNVENVSASDNSVSVTYQEPAKFLGFI